MDGSRSQPSQKSQSAHRENTSFTTYFSEAFCRDVQRGLLVFWALEVIDFAAFLV